MIAVEVRDDGPGIPRPLLSRIFDPFARATNASRIDRAEGYGHGFPVARALGDSMDGTLDVRSTGPDGKAMAVDQPGAAL